MVLNLLCNTSMVGMEGFPGVTCFIQSGAGYTSFEEFHILFGEIAPGD
jgi:hypothetical protein